MTAPLPGTPFGALNAWPDAGKDGDGARWLYLPHAPAPQRNPGGRAQLTMIEAGDMLMLTLGTHLTVDEPTLAAARASIAKSTGGRPEDIDLRPAAAQATGARLMLEQDDTEPVELAKVQPSPSAPYSAAFSAMLRGDAAKAAMAALKQGTGRLTVAYDLDLPGQRTATATIHGDPGDDADVEHAIGAGRLTVTTTADEGASTALKDRALREAIAAARHAIAALPGPTECGEFEEQGTTRAIDAHATRVEPDPRRLTLAANVADWL